MAQAVQILKQAPEGSSREHTDSSQPASWMPLLPLAGPGVVALQSRLFWILMQRSEASCQRPQDWNLSSMLEQAVCSQSASRCTAGFLHFLETECCGPGCSDPESSRQALLDSPEHTDSSQSASRMPLLPPAGPGDVEL